MDALGTPEVGWTPCKTGKRYSFVYLISFIVKIIYFFEHLRRLLMKRNQERREMKIDSRLYPTIQGLVEKTKNESRKCDVHYAQGLIF